jgi:hypothetical protein
MGGGEGGEEGIVLHLLIPKLKPNMEEEGL